VCGFAGAGAGDAGGDVEECLMMGCGEVDDDVCDGGRDLILFYEVRYGMGMKCTAEHETRGKGKRERIFGHFLRWCFMEERRAR
jgi:hypothetical protein